MSDLKTTPYTLIVKDNQVVRLALENVKKINSLERANGLIFEDWETAEKVAFGSNLQSGKTIDVACIKYPVFISDNTPNWAQTITATQAIININLRCGNSAGTSFD